MKDKIFVFIIGLLVGAVITASGFLIYEKVSKKTNQMPNVEGMQMMEKPDGEKPQGMPDNMKDDQNRPEPPSKNDASTNNK